jgi:hypothetical protein
MFMRNRNGKVAGILVLILLLILLPVFLPTKFLWNRRD